MAIAYVQIWCSNCSSTQRQMRTRLYFVCMTCYHPNNGKHPAEDCLAVRIVKVENKILIRKNMNKRRVFPKLQHTAYKRMTAMGSRSIKLAMFKRG